MLTIATLETGSFSFTAVGSSRPHAERVMSATWAKHRREYDARDSWDEVREDVNYTDALPGEGMRDFAVIVDGVR